MVSGNIMLMRRAEGGDADRDDAEGRANIGQWTDLFTRDIDHQYVSERQVARAAGLVAAIGREASGRGFAVAAPSARLFAKARKDKWAWPHIIVSTQDGQLLSFHLSECSRSGTEPKTRTLADRRSPDGTPTWQMQRSTCFEPTGVMSIKVDSDITHYRVKTSRDSDSTTVETRLPNLFDALVEEIVRCGDVRRSIADRRRRERDSRTRCHTERMYAALCDEVSMHERAQRQRDYLDQVEAGLGGGAGDDAVRQAISMMRTHIDGRDPLVRGGSDWTNQPEPTEDEAFEYARLTGRATPTGACAAHRAAAPTGRHADAGPGSGPSATSPARGRHRPTAAGAGAGRTGGFFD
ncbi:hypothetical protein JS528_08625 [Bifidobacterium sp. MA2]|uniref:Uncharacterized protein n=1 Tax=Bifidobacterium santillanense TaxID=2809028 RepID=A0ABS5UR21_9BIFI|nr:hypothetical protein [Bifidobacterium santillanense]MBT1173409.1 hypothetical protein [Bifidobacterium santillanense]